MANSSGPPLTFCPPPFLSEANYPDTGGYAAGRYCGRHATGVNAVSCCLPCPLQDWVYTDSFPRNLSIAYWFNVPGLVLQIFLLLSFAILPEEKSHRHYLTAGLSLSLMFLQLSFIVPLGTRPSLCHDAVTPGDMYTSQSCAWSGALLDFGAMAVAVWILLRSIWTSMRVIWDVRQTAIYFWLAQIIGWGLPGLFLAISVPVTGMSYRVGPSCILNHEHALATWSGWLIAFAALAAIVQFWTTGYCFVLYTEQLVNRPLLAKSHEPAISLLAPGGERPADMQAPAKQKVSNTWTRRFAWKRIVRIWNSQWRSILLCILVIIQSTFFGIVFVQEANGTSTKIDQAKAMAIESWTKCIAMSGSNKNKCLDQVGALGIDEGTLTASLFINALIGIFAFILMVRWSMFIGWFELVRPNKQPTTPLTPNGPTEFWSPKRGRHTRPADDAEALTTTVRSEEHELCVTAPEHSASGLSVPEAGDVTTRHETTNLFEDDEELKKEIGGGDKKL